MAKKHLYLVDATAFCYRAFYAVQGLSTSFGQPTNAVFGFTNMLNKLLKDKKPEYMAVCFDVSRETFRQKKFADYKIQRPSMPDGLSSQVPLIKEVVAAYGIPIFEKEGYEADDIIADLASQASGKDFFTTIVSSDKDMLQLVGSDTEVYNPYKDDGVTYDVARVKERYSVAPENISDILALIGDNVDNIPGVPGIGEKTAVGLITRFGSVEYLLDNLDKLTQSKLRDALRNNAERVRLNKELVSLRVRVGLEFDPEKLRLKTPDYRELFRLFKSLEFGKLARELPVEAVPESPAEAEEISDTDAGKLMAGGDELYIHAVDEGEPVFCVNDRIFRVKDAGEKTAQALASPAVKKVGFDLKRLVRFLAARSVVLSGLEFDAMLADYLLNSSKPAYTLQDMAWEHLGEVANQQNIGAVKGLELLRRLKPVLLKKLEERSLLGLFKDIEMPLVGILAEMELTGIKVDPLVLRDLSVELEGKLAGLIARIYKECGCEFNINSPKQLREVLFDRLKLPVVKRTKTGPSTDEEVLRTLAIDHKLPGLLLEYRQLAKLKSTYIDVLPQLIDPATGRIHGTFNQTGTETGRLSSANPNLQNIPVRTEFGRKIRRAIVASESRDYLVSCDYSQIELRVLAHFSGDELLIKAFRQGKDIHRATAGLVAGVEESEVTDEMRDAAKRVNFGIVYGLTPFGLSKDLGISLDEAGNFIDSYFLRYPKVKEYMQAQIHFCEAHGYVTTLLGRRRYLPDINNKNLAIRQFAQRQAVNAPIQGSASDLIKLAMIRIHARLAETGMGVKMVLQVHDELVFEVPQGCIDDFVVLARDGMENAVELKVPVKVSIKKGRNWLEMEEVNI